MDERLARALEEPKAVRELDLSAANLTEVPREVAKLVNLEVLRLDRNELTALPEAVAKLKALRELHAAHNRITSAGIHRQVWFIKPLEVLNLHDNQLAWVDNIGNYQKSAMDVYLAGNPLDVNAYTMGGTPVHPLWNHALHMVNLAGYGKFSLRVLSLDLDVITFPLPGSQLHFEPPFPKLRVLQLYGRAPTVDERDGLTRMFPEARIEHHAGEGPHLVPRDDSPPAPGSSKPAAKKKR